MNNAQQVGGLNSSVLLTIGISDPGGGLAELPGAMTASREMAAWARSVGYDVLAFQDKDDTGKRVPVTTECLNREIHALLDTIRQERRINRLVIHFAGHGLLVPLEKRYWLLNDWHINPRAAIDVNRMRYFLRFQQIDQISLIADACSVVDAISLRVEGSGVLNMSGELETDPESDQFYSSAGGWKAFMAKATDERTATCIFSDLFIEALYGRAPDAFENPEGSPIEITSRSLARYLKKAVPYAAGKAGVQMLPSLAPAFYTDETYARFDRSLLTRDPGPLVPGEKLASNEAPEAKGLPPEATKVAAEQEVREKIDTGNLANDIAGIGRIFQQAMEIKYESNLFLLGDFKPDFITVNGLGKFAGRPLSSAVTSSDALIVDGYGFIHYAPIFPNLQTFIARFDDSQTIVLQSRFTIDVGPDWARVLALLIRNRLTVSETSEIAAHLRQAKHINPVRGAIAGYLYDAIGDVESVRRTAAFYPRYGQPVPLDIAILCDLPIRLHSRGGLAIDLPKVPQRPPRNEMESERPFTTAAMPSQEDVRIAGSMPQMTAGFASLSRLDLSPELEAWSEAGRDLRHCLQNGVFTTLSADGKDSALAMMRVAGMRKENI